MPLTKKGKKIMSAMRKQYGKKEGEKVFYASKNKGTIKGVDMPEVGGKSFGYGKKGKAAAKKYAKKHGLKVKKKKNPGYYAESTVAEKINRVLSSILSERHGEGHQFSKQRTKSGMKVSGRHDPRAQQATQASARNRAMKDPEGVDPDSGMPRQRITARGPKRPRFKRYS